MELPRYDPPIYRQISASLNDRLKDFLAYWDNRNQYDIDYFTRLRNLLLQGVDTTPYKAIASASTIKPLRPVQPVTGGVTVSTISAAVGFNQVTLLAVDGFSVDTTGNITVAKPLPKGTATLFFLNLITNKWFPT